MPSTTITLSSGVSYAPYGTLTVTEAATSSANNNSTASAVLVLHRPYAIQSTATKTASMTINGTTYNWSGTIGGSGDLTLLSRTITIPHDSDGSKTINISATIQLAITWGGTYIDSISNSGTLKLTKLDRYPSASCSLKSKTETTLTVNWSSDSTITKVEYSRNGGSSYTTYSTNANAKSGSFTISGLSANTSYSVRVRLTSKTSSLATASSTVSMTTYAYPYANSMPNITIGTSATIGVYNPLGRTFTLTIIAADNEEVTTVSSYTGTSVSGFKSSEYLNLFYNSIPNAKSGTYKVRINYGSHTETRTGGTYSVNESLVRPSIGSLAYADTNATTIAITGDNQKIIQLASTVRFTASNVTAQQGATVSRVSVSVNGATVSLTASGTTWSGGSAQIDSSTNVTATATVTDSRGVTTTATVTIQMEAYSRPTAIVNAQREYNFYNETDLTVNASYSSLNGGNQLTIQYRYKETSATTWSEYVTMQNNVPTVINLDNTKTWNIQVLLTDSLGGTTTINTPVVPKGIPHTMFDFLRNSVGFNCIPQHDDSLEVGGDIYEGGTALEAKYAPKLSVLANESTLGWTGGTTVATGGDWKTLGSYTFEPGQYIIFTRLRVNGNTNGTRRMMWSNSASSIDAWRENAYEVVRGCAGWTNLQCVFFAASSTSETKYLRFYQDSGSALAVYVSAQIIKIG